MIKVPTVFVLGAGASMPYGLPSGADLRARICGATIEPERNGLGQQIMRCGELTVADVKKFGLAFSRSNIASIDAFLAMRPEYTNIGKVAIATTIALRQERRYSMYMVLRVPLVPNLRQARENTALSSHRKAFSSPQNPFMSSRSSVAMTYLKRLESGLIGLSGFISWASGLIR